MLAARQDVFLFIFCEPHLSLNTSSRKMILQLSPYILFALIILIPLALNLRRIKKREVMARESAAKGQLYSSGPSGQHPHIDTSRCIGCGGCVDVCPEGDVLAVFASLLCFPLAPSGVMSYKT